MTRGSSGHSREVRTFKMRGDVCGYEARGWCLTTKMGPLNGTNHNGRHDDHLFDE